MTFFIRSLLWGLLAVLVGCTSATAPQDNDNSDLFDTGYYSVSGQVLSSTTLVLDSDTKDSSIIAIDNNDPLRAQPLQPRQQVLGWVSAEDDPSDYFKVTLKAGQSVQLQVLHASSSNDLDLFVFPAQTNDSEPLTVGYSQNTGRSGAVESINIADAGDYLVLVEAATGASSYVLQFNDEPDSQAQSVGLFKTGEAVVQHRAQQHQPMRASGNTSHTAKPLPVKVKLSRTNHRPMALSNLGNTPAWQAQLDTLRAIKALNQEPDIEYAEPNFIRRLFKTPNDSLLTKQHALKQINLPRAWDISTGEESDVVVAILDTGVYMQHEDLKNKLVDGYDFISDLTNAGDGDGIDSNPDDPGDDADITKSSWHGTHVAGIVAAQTNNDKGMAGVSWGAKVMPLRVMGRDGGESNDIAQAIRYAAGLANDSGTVPSRKANIINMSFGSEGIAQAEREAVAAALAEGVIVVAAMGNDGQRKTYYPAAYSGVIAVAATNPNGQHAYYSNYGAHTSIAAPGGEILDDGPKEDGILSTFVSVNTINKRSSAYAYSDGTSMATPHVAGVLALMKAVNPELNYQQVHKGIKYCLITKQPSNQCHKSEKLGYGEVDAYSAVQFAQDPELWLDNYKDFLLGTPDSLTVNRTGKTTLTLTNPSSYPVELLEINTSEGNMPGWLIVNDLPTSIEANSTANIELTIDGNGLSAGHYSHNLMINYLIKGNSWVLETPIKLSLLEHNIQPQISLYIRLEDLNCRQQLGSNSSSCIWQQHSDDGNFDFDLIPSGHYRLSASTDVQGLGKFCQTGEACAIGNDFILKASLDSSSHYLHLGIVETNSSP